MEGRLEVCTCGVENEVKCCMVALGSGNSVGPMDNPHDQRSGRVVVSSPLSARGLIKLIVEGEESEFQDTPVATNR